MFIWYLVYEKIENRKEKIILIRELTVAIKSENVVEYKDNTPEYTPIELTEEKQDELIPLEDIDPKVLLRSISK